jgi:hypothetical protein
MSIMLESHWESFYQEIMNLRKRAITYFCSHLDFLALHKCGNVRLTEIVAESECLRCENELGSKESLYCQRCVKDLGVTKKTLRHWWSQMSPYNEEQIPTSSVGQFKLPELPENPFLRIRPLTSLLMALLQKNLWFSDDLHYPFKGCSPWANDANFLESNMQVCLFFFA